LDSAGAIEPAFQPAILFRKTPVLCQKLFEAKPESANNVAPILSDGAWGVPA
jgi:hypothetical protein